MAAGPILQRAGRGEQPGQRPWELLLFFLIYCIRTNKELGVSGCLV